MTPKAHKTIIKIWRIFWKRRDHLLRGFLPIIDNKAVLNEVIEKNNRKRFTRQYVIPFVLSLYLSVETLYFLHNFAYDLEKPLYFHHCILSFMDSFFRKQSDVMFSTAYPMIVIVYGMLIVDRMPHLSSHMMFPSKKIANVLRVKDGTRIDSSLSKSLITFDRQSRKLLDLCSVISEIEGNVGFTFPLIFGELYNILIRQYYNLNYRYWFCALLCPFLLHYTATLVRMGVSFVVLNLSINIKQRHYLNKMERSFAFFDPSSKDSLNSSKYYKAYKSLRLFKSMLKTLQSHTTEIRVWNRFYSPYVSVMVLAYGIIGCSILHGAQNSPPNVSPILLGPWVLFSSMYLLCIFLFTFSGSKTVLLNRALFLKIRALQTSICNLKTLRNKREVVHLDLVNEYKLLLLKNNFRLVNSISLNNKTFYFTLWGFVSVIYMKTITRK